jgi:hypothetical protein
MAATEWAAVATGVVSVVAGVAAGIRWMVKHYLNELKPNGGGSMNDRMKRIEDNQVRLHERVDAIFEFLMGKK